MKEAIGGVFSLEFIIVFLLILNGYLAFSVNYTKAFRVKNEIRSIIQKNEGLTEDAMKDISEYMTKVNYNQNHYYNDWCKTKGLYTCVDDSGRSFCMDVKTSSKYGTRDGKNIAAYYTVYTFVDIHIPILERFLPYAGGIFSVTGETSLIYTKETPTLTSDTDATLANVPGVNCTK